MTNLTFPPLPANLENDEQLGDEITLLAGQINAAFAAGEISYSKVRAITRVATTENEDYLLHIARHGTASHVERVVRKCRKVRRQDNNAVEREQDNERQLVYYQDEDGMWIIHAKLPPEAVEKVEPCTLQKLLSHTRADALVAITEHFLRPLVRMDDSGA